MKYGALFCFFAFMLIAGCSSSEKPANAAAEGTRGDQKSMLAIVPPPPDSAAYGDDREDRTFVKASYRYTRKFYVDRLKSAPAGAPPAKQFEFKAEQSNVPLKSYTIDGSTAPSKAAEPSATEVPLYTAKGEQTKLANFKGKPLVVVFTRGFPGYICPMCVAYTAQLTLAYDEIKKRGAEMMIVFPGPKEKMDQFVKACLEAAEEDAGALPFPVCLDADLALVSRFNLQADLSRPATIVFDAQGEDAFCHIGTDPSERPKTDAILKTLDGLSRQGNGR